MGNASFEGRRPHSNVVETKKLAIRYMIKITECGIVLPNITENLNA